MYYIGVDPGANFTGVVTHDGEKFTRWKEFLDPVAVWREIEAPLEAGWEVTVILEDFTGTGRLNRYRKKTMEVLGYIRFRCNEARERFGSQLRCVIQIQQRRKPYVSAVPKAIVGKDEIAAAAHVIAYLTRQRIIPSVRNQQAVFVQRKPQPRRPT